MGSVISRIQIVRPSNCDHKIQKSSRDQELYLPDILVYQRSQAKTDQEHQTNKSFKFSPNVLSLSRKIKISSNCKTDKNSVIENIDENGIEGISYNISVRETCYRDDEKNGVAQEISDHFPNSAKFDLFKKTIGNKNTSTLNMVTSAQQSNTESNEKVTN